MKNCLALLIFALLCACHGQTQVFRTLRTLTARPFNAQELRVLFANCGKQASTVQQPGICPEKWTFPEKTRPYTTALLMWNSTFEVASQGKYTFRLSEPDVCSALYVDGSPAASWKESFPPIALADGTHSIQMLVAQRPGEKLPVIFAYREGYALKLQYNELKLDRKLEALFFMQTGACLASVNGSIVDAESSDGIKCIVPARRVDTRARIAKMPLLASWGKAINLLLSMEYPEYANAFMDKVEVNVYYETHSGRQLGNEAFAVSGQNASISISPNLGAEIARMVFSVAGKPVFPECKLLFVSPESKAVLRAVGRSFFVEENRALPMIDRSRKIALPKAMHKDVILDVLGDADCLEYARKAYPDADVLSLLPKPGTLPELCALEKLPENAGHLILLGAFSPEMLAFACRRCVALGCVPVPVALPGDRLAALAVKESGLRMGVQVLDLWSDMMK